MAAWIGPRNAVIVNARAPKHPDTEENALMCVLFGSIFMCPPIRFLAFQKLPGCLKDRIQSPILARILDSISDLARILDSISDLSKI